MSSEERAADDFGLVMPFIVCQSNGGPWEDASFVAGWECAQIQAHLERNQHWPVDAESLPYGPSVREQNLPQIDLIAMHVGFTVDSFVFDEFDESTGWASVRFNKSCAE